MTHAYRANLAIAFMLAGCAGSPNFVGRPDLQYTERGDLPPPTTADLIGRPRAYVIGPLDQLAVDVYGVPELSRSVQVDASGRISMPLVGSVPASGKTPAELAELVAAQLRGKYVRDPRVTVNLTQTVSQTITVDGAVQSPGVYPVAGELTLIRAIARASGTGEFADERRVVVMRRVNNRDMAALYDLRAIRLGMYKDPDVYPNDIIMVGDSASKRFFKNALQASGLLTAPLIAILN